MDILDVLPNHAALKLDRAYPRQAPGHYPFGVLLTGATSFIGIHVLKELCEIWPGKIFCLLRCNDADHGRARLQQTMKDWGIKKFSLEKVIIYPGQCGKEQWGLDDLAFEHLRQEVGSVIHMALHGRYTLPFSYYDKHWLPDLLNMMDFCGHEKSPKFLHYPGSYSAHFFRTAEDFYRLGKDAWHCGYAGFKWLAEKLLLKAFNNGLGGCLYDIPIVLGSHTTGACPPQYSLFRIAEAFFDHESIIDYELTFITADCLASVIVENALSQYLRIGVQFSRPVFDQPVTQKDLIRLFKHRVNFDHVDQKTLLASVPEDQQRIMEYMLPEDFSQIISDAHRLPAILPQTFDKRSFPDAGEAFSININHWWINHYCQAEKNEEVSMG